MKHIRLPAVTSLAAALVLSGGCGSKEDSSTTQASRSSEPVAEAKLIDYGKDAAGGVAIKKPADVSKLTAAPDDFKQFVAGLIDQAVKASEKNKDCPVIVSVVRIDTSGFAIGGISECDGAALMWAKVDGIWQEIFGGQISPPCADMKKYSVPKVIAGDKCFDGENEVDYEG